MNNELRIVNPPFNLKVTDLIINIERLRKRQLAGNTQPQFFSDQAYFSYSRKHCISNN